MIVNRFFPVVAALLMLSLTAPNPALATTECKKIFGLFRFNLFRNSSADEAAKATPEPPVASLVPDPTPKESAPISTIAPVVPNAVPFVLPAPKYKTVSDLIYSFPTAVSETFQSAMKQGGQQTEEDLLVLVNNTDRWNASIGNYLKFTPAEARIDAAAQRREISREIYELSRGNPVAPESEVRAARNSERGAIPEFPKRLRASDEEVLAMRREYPLVGSRIDEFTNDLSKLQLKDGSPEQLLKESDITKIAGLAKRLAEEVDPVLRRTIERVWQRMNDNAAFAAYVKALAEDSAVAMRKSGSERKLDALKRGELVRNAVMETLVARHRANDNGAFATIVGRNAESNKPTSKTRKGSDNKSFREAVGQGPFFDKPFDGIRHGIDTHFMQIDYVSDVIWKETNGNPRLFWDYLGSKKGIHFWVPLFDNFSSETTISSPERTAHAVSALLKITD